MRLHKELIWALHEELALPLSRELLLYQVAAEAQGVLISSVDTEFIVIISAANGAVTLYNKFRIDDALVANIHDPDWMVKAVQGVKKILTGH